MAVIKSRLPMKNILDILKSPRFLDSLGTQVVIEMKKAIAQGMSPVFGEGRFVAYSAQRNPASPAHKAMVRLRINNLNKIIRNNHTEVSTERLKSIRSGYQSIAKGFRYPLNVRNKYPNKQIRPVNLELSGEMLEALTYKKNSKGITIGIFKSDQIKKAQGHQVGDDSKSLPRRRFIPAKSGEKYTVSITRLIKTLYSEALASILKK